MAGSVSSALFLLERLYSELTKTSTALPRLAVTCVLSAARHPVLILLIHYMIEVFVFPYKEGQ